uniref:CRISPR type III-associated protein domain-containing protein n=1 Tax=Caldiarchaeum subterraneum TaxID=311458 RepID=A0A7J3G536_CALS0
MRMFWVRVRPVGLLTVGGSAPASVGPDIVFTSIYEKGGRRLYIPGPSFKGALRSAASRVANPYGFSSCGQVRPDLISSAHAQVLCDVCKLFGHPSRSYLPVVFFSDLVPAAASPWAVTRVRIEDSTLKALEGGLYSAEVVAGVEFVGSVRYGEDALDLLPLLLLAAAELRMDRFGRASAVDLKLENTDQLQRDVPSDWHGLLDGLGEWLWKR